MSLGHAQSLIRPGRRYLASATRSLIAAELCFWLYTFYFIAQHGDLKGSGLEVLAMIPMAAITLFLVVPALILAFLKRSLWLALGLALLAAAADAVAWPQIVGEIGRATSGA